MINHILINVWSIAHSSMGTITSRASDLNGFIAHVVVKYLLQSREELKWLVEVGAAWCLHVSSQLTVSCAVTQVVTCKNSLVIISILHLSGAIGKHLNHALEWNWAICRCLHKLPFEWRISSAWEQRWQLVPLQNNQPRIGLHARVVSNALVC